VESPNVGPDRNLLEGFKRAPQQTVRLEGQRPPPHKLRSGPGQELHELKLEYEGRHSSSIRGIADGGQRRGRPRSPLHQDRR